MAIGTVSGLLEYVDPAQEYLQAHFGLESSTARDVVEDVLMGLFRDGPEKLRRPRRYFFQACRIRAFQILRSRRRRDRELAVVENRRMEAKKHDNEVLIALDDEDKPKFFGPAEPEDTESLNFMLERDNTSEVTATLETPDSKVRMRIHLALNRLGGAV